MTISFSDLFRTRDFVVLGATTLVSFTAILLLNNFFSDAYFELESVHTVLELLGAFTAIAMVLLLANQPTPVQKSIIGVMIGFLGLGIFDIFHGLTHELHDFVLLHSLAGLSGGVGFALVWLPLKQISGTLGRRILLLTALLYVVISSIIILVERGVPMVDHTGSFTDQAALINHIAGILFLAGYVRLLILGNKEDSVELRALAFVALLLGLGQLLFRHSEAWGVSWWFWHLIRFIAYAVAIWIAAVSFQQTWQEIRQQRDSLERQAIKLSRVNDELEQFAYVASHDLRAPLRAIVNLTEWLEEDLRDSLQPENQEHMDLLKNRVARMEHLLDDLLLYSRAGRVHYDVCPVNVTEMLHEQVDLMQLEERFKVTIGDMPTFDTVEVALTQVFQNLLANIAKHHDQETGTIEISSDELPDSYQFSVTDDGPGIPEKFRDKVFGMFQTLKPKDEVEGSGMGLAMVKKYVERYGGQIQLLDAESRGTQVRFSWPKRISEDGNEQW